MLYWNFTRADCLDQLGLIYIELCSFRLRLRADELRLDILVDLLLRALLQPDLEIFLLPGGEGDAINRKKIEASGSTLRLCSKIFFFEPTIERSEAHLITNPN